MNRIAAGCRQTVASEYVAAGSCYEGTLRISQEYTVTTIEGHALGRGFKLMNEVSTSIREVLSRIEERTIALAQFKSYEIVRFASNYAPQTIPTPILM